MQLPLRSWRHLAWPDSMRRADAPFCPPVWPWLRPPVPPTPPPASAAAGRPTVTVPPNAGVYKIGNPYQIDNVWYYPREQPDYDETGIASWYGPTFYGKHTANGEIYDGNALTAAHRTLPMPVNVRVTNLENGKSIIVRVNDRGPYARGRIIDLSRRAAELLDVVQTGTARVRVTYLGRADHQRRRPPPPETPPEIASALPAAPAGQGGHGRRWASCRAPRWRRPCTTQHAARRRAPSPPMQVAANQPTGQVDQGSRAAGDASLCPGGRLLQAGQCQDAVVQAGRGLADFHPSTGRPDPL